MSDLQPGFINAYVVVTPDVSGVTAVQFSAPKPPCFTGAYVTDQPVPGTLVIGNSQTGVSVALQYCQGTPTHVLTIQYYGYGTTPPCCEYPVLPDPTTNDLQVVNCLYGTATPVSASSIINADETCFCGTNFPPSPPFNPVPDNDAAGVTVWATLGWEAVDSDGNIAGYDVYFGTTSPPPLVAARTTPDYVPSPQPLQPFTQHYWRVVVRDSVGEETSGPVWSFSTGPLNAPPNPPTGPIPGDGASGVGITTSLGWSATDIDGEPLTFDVYFGTSVTPPVVASNHVANSYALDSLSFSTTYYWRVVARDTSGAETAGPTWSFSTRPENYPPNAPSNPSPPNSSTLRPITSTLAWQCTDPDGQPLVYDVYFGTTSPPPLAASNVTVTSFAPGPLAFVTTYHWRIIARDSKGAETAGPAWSFTTKANSAPTAPSSPSPANNSTGRPLSTTLSWQCTDADGEPLVYDVYFGTTSPPPLAADEVTAASFAPDTLVFATMYHWRIVARDPNGAETSGAAWSFTTKGNSPPGTPASPSPANNATGRPLSTTLSWQCTDADGDPLVYDVYFGTGSTPPLVASGVSQTVYSPGALAYFTTYRWRIVARDPLGAETSGPNWSFTTKANSPPNYPSNPSPLSGATNRPVTTTLAWQCTDPDAQPLVFDVYFGTNDPPPLNASEVTQAAFDPGPLAVATVYRWRIVARDPLGAERSSIVWNFSTLGNTAPSPPAEPSPADQGASVLSPVLTWLCLDPDAQQLTYTVHFGTTISPPTVATGLTTRSFVPGALQRGVRYYWRVSVSDGIAAVGGPLWSFTAVEPGDVDLDGQVTVADAGCALDAYLRDGSLPPACGGAVGAVAADAGCNGIVTPNDARCIRRKIANNSCAFCSEGAAGGTAAVVTASHARIVDDTLRVTLRVGDAALRAFGFSVHTPSKLKLVEASPLAVPFDALGAFALRAGVVRVGGYALGDVSATAPVAFVELRFAPAGAARGWLHVNDFVDDLTGAAPVQVSLDGLLAAAPPANEVVLQQNQPNPFNPQTTIRYDLPARPAPQRVRLRIVDVSGRVVRTLVDEYQSTGSHAALWNGTDDAGTGVSSGIYFSVLDVGGERRTRKLVLLK